MIRITIIIMMMLSLAGCGMFAISNQSSSIKAAFLEIPREEIMRDGELQADLTLQLGIENDEEFYMYWEVYDGDTFLKSHLEELEMNKRTRNEVFKDSYIMKGADPGKHSLRYKLMWTNGVDHHDCKNTFKYINDAGKAMNWKGVCKSTQIFCDMFTKSLVLDQTTEQCPAWRESDFDSNIQYSKYLTGPMYVMELEHIFCVDYCGELTTEIIKDVVIQQCTDDVECADLGGVCEKAANGVNYCVKEIINNIETEKITPLYIDTTCADFRCDSGYRCVDDAVNDRDIAYCIKEDVADTDDGIDLLNIGLFGGISIIILLALTIGAIISIKRR